MYDDLNRRQTRVEVNTARVRRPSESKCGRGGRKISCCHIAFAPRQHDGAAGSWWQHLRGAGAAAAGLAAGVRSPVAVSMHACLVKAYQRTRTSPRPPHPSPAAARAQAVTTPLTRVCLPVPFSPDNSDQLLPLLAEAASADAGGRYRDAARYVTSVGALPQHHRPTTRAVRPCGRVSPQLRRNPVFASPHCAAPPPSKRADHTHTHARTRAHRRTAVVRRGGRPQGGGALLPARGESFSVVFVALSTPWCFVVTLTKPAPCSSLITSCSWRGSGTRRCLKP